MLKFVSDLANAIPMLITYLMADGPADARERSCERETCSEWNATAICIFFVADPVMSEEGHMPNSGA